MTIVPSNRLLFYFAVIILPLTIAAVIVPATSSSGIGLAVVFLCVAGVDAVISRNRLAGLHIRMPEVVRLSVGRDGEIIVSIENDAIRVKRLRIGLAFPREIHSSTPDLITDLPPETPNSTIGWPFRALKQGMYLLENCYLETASRMGLWSLRRTDPAHTEIRAYPDLFREQKKLSGLFLNRGIGIHAQRQIGKGKEFEQLREYLPCDSYEDIHWKATAKRGQPITKVYQIERTQQIYAVIDGSRLSARNSDAPGNRFAVHAKEIASPPATIMERYAAAALVLGLAAGRQGDLFGLLAFDDRVRKFVRAKSGKAHYDGCRDALYTLQAHSVSPDFAELFTFIGTKIRRRALLLILTNLDDPVLAESFTANIDLISRQHLVLVNMIAPAAAEPLFSNPAVECVDDLYHKLGGHILWRHLREVERSLHRRGIGFGMLQNENLCVDLVSQYLTIKRRQIL